jgi:catechol 2,3-dioxygenase-like lactoylglutathione lyase family enzyme
MLTDKPVFATIPASDIERAKRFYLDLGMTLTRETPGGLELESGGVRFDVFPTHASAGAGHTLAGWVVDDIEAEVAELRAKGIVFEEYDLPGLKTVDGIALIEGQERAAWFKDSEGNILALGEPLP